MGVGGATAAGGRSAGAKGHVVVVGGGYAGATTAKYLRMWSGGAVAVTLVEPNDDFVSCPISNLVLGGSKTMGFITSSYAKLESVHGVKRVKSTVASVDAAGKAVVLADGTRIGYDRLVLAPGVDFDYGKLPGLASPAAQAQVLHAWKAGPQTAALRRQLEAMPDGGVYALAIPRAPYRCPPGPYERACQVASYFKAEKPRSKVLVLDANEDVTSKGKLFKAAWSELYPGIVEYRANHTLTDVDVAGRRLLFEFNDPVKADVLNVVPPMGAGAIAVRSGLATANGRWCEVDFLTFESKAAKGIHVLGDSIQVAPAMPKSGHMANQHAKVAAAAILAQLDGREVSRTPVVTNTCYSFVSAQEVVHVASVHQYDAAKQTFLAVPGAGGLSPSRNRLEAVTGLAWAVNIWADTLA
ncbi:MAG: FCSD flavin-binding domain-containing protein [Lautropia sp.]